jgi:NAD(P)-dependent dehydrogenase (short-subunit alcohol dehydrogenase family)
MELSGAVAVVTGASRGIGRDIAAAYAAKGVRTAMVASGHQMLRAAAEELRETGAEVLPVVCDITSAQQVEAMIKRVCDQWAPPDIVVNNAGSLSAIGPIWEVSPERWKRDLDVNLLGTFLVCRAALGHMVRRKAGYVINVVTYMGDPHRYVTAYDASKVGAVRLTEAVAWEAGEFGVKAFALYPGTVPTAMARFLLESPEGRKYRPDFREMVDAGRIVSTEPAVRCAMELVSGRFDALSGRYLDATQDLEGLLRQTDSILAENRLTLRLRK